MVDPRILYAKNQHLRPKTVAYRPRTDRQTDTQTDRQTDRHTDIHKGNNNEIKYAKDITAVKNNTLWVHLDAIRCFCTIIGEIIKHITLIAFASNLLCI